MEDWPPWGSPPCPYSREEKNMPLSSHYQYTDATASHSKVHSKFDRPTYQQDKNLDEMHTSESQRLSVKT
jgi:hypothetical protein